MLGAATAVVAAQAAGARPGPWQQGILLALAVHHRAQARVDRRGGAARRRGVHLGAGARDTRRWSWSPPPAWCWCTSARWWRRRDLPDAGRPRAGAPLGRARLLLWLAAAAVWGLSVAWRTCRRDGWPTRSGLTLLTVIAVAATWLIRSGRDRKLR